MSKKALNNSIHDLVDSIRDEVESQQPSNFLDMFEIGDQFTFKLKKPSDIVAITACLNEHALASANDELGFKCEVRKNQTRLRVTRVA